MQAMTVSSSLRMLLRPLRRWLRTTPASARRALGDSLAAALACVVAWHLSHFLFGQPKPVFAAMTTVVCLAPGLPNHLRQTWSMLLGCVLGIVVGDLAWLLPDHHFLLRLSGATLVSMLIAALFSSTPVVPIQAATSTLLVLAMGPSTAGGARLLDVMVGAATGIVFSQVLFTTDPVRAMARAASTLLQQLGDGLEAMQAAVQARSQAQAEHALGRLTRANDALAALRVAVQQAQSESRWSLRGRLAAEQVGAITRRYDRHAVRVYACSLLLGESLSRSLAHTSEAMPASIAQRCDWLVQACQALAHNPVLVDLDVRTAATDPEAPEPGLPHVPLPPPWSMVGEQAQQLREALQALADSKRR
jgi:uncharacterized membrane protein YgaE (UPF0421/DUF939 family)